MRALLVSFVALTVMACSAATGGGDGGASGDGGSSSSDGSSGGGDGGGSAGGPIQFPAMCPAFSPCGGGIANTSWDYSGGCVEDPFADVKSACPSAEVKNATGSVKGTVSFTATSVTRNATTSVSATVVVPVSCTQGAPCSVIEAMLPAGSKCTGTGTCSCDVKSTDTISDTDTYTIQGNKVVTGGAEYEFCVSGSNLKYREGGSMPKHVGIFDLAKR